MTYQKCDGLLAETHVAQWLTAQGYEVLKRNYRKRFGEIDLIVRKDNLLCFVEVKARKNPAFSMMEIIVPSKQRKLIAVAKEFLMHYGYGELICRFDVALVNDNGSREVVYIPNAFTEQESGYWG